ncbi:hypothetical protein [Actinophytocola sp. KF-1]
MSTFLKLNAYVTEQNRQGVAVAAPTITLTLGDGTTVEFPVPFVPVGGHLALVPRISVVGETGVRVDLSRWSPAYVSAAHMVIFPARFDSQAVAVRVARGFDADPATSWNDPRDQMAAWLREWGPANGVRP